jgi:hypothetical protein
MVIGLAIIGVSSFADWTRTGTRHRNSYELVAVARRLEVVHNGALGALARGWVLAPLCSVLAATALVYRLPRLAALAAGLVSAATIALVLAVNSSPLRAEGAVTVAMAGAIMTLIGSVWAAFARPGRPCEET